MSCILLNESIEELRRNNTFIHLNLPNQEYNVISSSLLFCLRVKIFNFFLWFCTFLSEYTSKVKWYYFCYFFWIIWYLKYKVISASVSFSCMTLNSGVISQSFSDISGIQHICKHISAFINMWSWTRYLNYFYLCFLIYHIELLTEKFL